MDYHTVYFISDAHLGGPFKDAPEWERTMLEFFRTIQDRASAVYILGDLFDFWIEYRHAIRPDYFNTIHALRQLVERGVAVHYFAGNHDFALGPFLSETVGVRIYHGPHDCMLQGRAVHLYHGDGLIKKDVGYRILRRVLRNPLNQRLYKLLPPYIGVPLGSFCSGTSRRCNEHRMTESILAEYRENARRRLNGGSDIVFYAHTHEPEFSRWGDKTYCNTGAWMRNYNFATMQDGLVRLWNYRLGAEPLEIPAVERK